MPDNNYKPLGAVKYNVRTRLIGKPPTATKGKKLSGKVTFQGNFQDAATLLGKDIKTGEEIWISQKDRRSSMYILGSTGSGKSVLIQNMCGQDIRQKVRLSAEDEFKIGLCVIAPDSDQFDAIIARIPANREQDVILLDVIELAKQGYFFGLNLFYCSDPSDITKFELTVEQVTSIFEKVFEMSSQTPRLARYIKNITRTLIGTPYTMVEIPDLLLNADFRKQVITKPNSFWQSYNSLGRSEQEDRYESTMNRVGDLIDNQIIRHIVGQTTIFDFQKMINESKIVLVRLPGEYGDLGRLLGSILIGQLLQAALLQDNLPRNKRPYFNLYIDEFQDYVTPAINKLLVQARKFNIASTVAHQSLFQDGITDEIRATTRQVGTLAFFKLANTDAKDIASVFDITPPVTKKPDPVISSKVLEELYHHKDEKVRRFYTKYLRRWQEAIKDQIKEQYVGSRMGTDGLPTSDTVYDFPETDLGNGYPIAYNPQHLTEALLVLNDLFYETQMKEEINWKLYSRLSGIMKKYFKNDFFDALDDVLSILESPDGAIKIPSTQWQETLLSQQSFGEREKEIGNTLGHLKPGQAMVRLSDGEHLIETEDPPRIPNIKDKRDRMLKQTIKNYCKSRAEIEREIAKRIPSPQPPTQRKHTI